MALLQISEPGQAPDPHQRRIAVGIDLGTTHSLVAAVRHGVAECLPDAQGRVLLPSVVRYLEGGAARSASTRGPIRPRTRPTPSPRSSASWAAAWPTSQGAEQLPYEFVDQPGMVAVRTRAGPEDAGRGVGRDPGHAAPARRGQLRRRALRRGDHRAGLFRRCAAPGDEGRRAAGRPERAAPDQRAHRRGRGLRPGQRQRRPVCGLRPGRRHLRHLAAAPDARACSRWWPPAATRPWAATTSTTCWPPGRCSSAGRSAVSPQDKGALRWPRAPRRKR